MCKSLILSVAKRKLMHIQNWEEVIFYNSNLTIFSIVRPFFKEVILFFWVFAFPSLCYVAFLCITVWKERLQQCTI